MILESIFNLLFGVVDIIITLIPDMSFNFSGGVGSIGTLLSYGLYFFPVDLWIALLANIVFWLGVQAGWIVIEWTYKKIPGVE